MPRLFATVNDASAPLEMERSTPSSPWSIQGAAADIVRTGPGQYSVLFHGRSHRVLVIKEDRANRTVRLCVGSGLFTVRLEDEQQQLIKAMGLDKAAHGPVRDLKAPMPGLVLKVLVKEGDRVAKNDPVLVLEAMKMENVIKSPGEAVVGRVHVRERTAVEKGQLLLTFS